MKKITLFFAFIAFSISGIAQQFQWAQTFDVIQASAYFTNIALDAADNKYICGSLGQNAFSQYSMDLDNTSGNFIIDQNNKNSFVVKYDVNGNFVWGKRLGSSVAPYKIRMDNNGDLILFGNLIGNSFGNSIVFNPFDANPTTLDAYGEDMFFAKFSATTGNLVWVRHIQSTSTTTDNGAVNFFSSGVHARENSVVVDNQGSIIICGSASGIIDIDLFSDFGDNYNFGSGIEFILKYTNTGQLVWFLTNGSTSTSIGIGMAVDASNSVYYFGRNNQVFGVTDNEMYLIKISDSVLLNPKIEFIKSMPVNSGYILMSATSGDFPHGIKIDNTGNIYLYGNVKTTIDFNEGGSPVILTGPGYASIPSAFIAKYTPTGTLLWAKNAGTTEGSRVYNIGINANNQLVANMDIRQTSPGSGVGSDLDMGPGVVDTFGLFLAIYDGNANLSSYKRLFNRQSLVMAAGPEAVYLCGSTNDSFNFDLLNPNGYFDVILPVQEVAYFAKYNYCKDNVNQVTATICQGDTYTFGTQSLNLAGSYTNSFTVGLCDSVVVLNLSVTVVDSSVSRTTNTLKANQNNAAYKWIDCNTNTEIAGATSQTFTPTATGNYKVEVTKGACSIVSNCHNIGTIGIKNNITQSIAIYPNPARDVLNIQQVQLVRLKQADIIDIYGKIIRSQLLDNNNLNIQIDIKDLSSGIYMLKLIDEKQEQGMFKFIKK